MSRAPALTRPLAVALVLACAACGSEGEGATAEGARRADGRRADGGRGPSESTDGGVAIVSRTTYRVAPAPQPGVVQGVVRLDGTAPPDSTHQVGRDSARCGATVIERAVQARDGALADAVVWLDDVRAGKPLPELRRLALSHERCQYDPHVQAASAPSTLNVQNDDRAVHVTTVSHVGAAKPLLSIPFTDDGQVVPTELAARVSGVVEVRCVQHPWAKAYVAAFDHPYYAVTAADGRFTLDGVPPGRYTLKVWHPRGRQVVATPVTVAGGGAVSVEPRVAVR